MAFTTAIGGTAIPTRDVHLGVTVLNPDASSRQTSAQRGLIATALMTLYRFPVFRALPPTADFWSKYVGDGDTEAYPGTGLVLHFLYGGAAGGLFGVGISLLDFRNERERALGTIGLSLVYSLALSAFGTRVIFQHFLDEGPKPAEAVIFHVGHVIYGLTLGTWINAWEQRGEVYE